MALSTLPVLTRTTVVQMIKEDDFLSARLLVGDQFGVARDLASRIREQGLYTMRIAVIYAVCANLCGRPTIYDHIG